MKMRGTATDKLADVIQMLLLVQKTGVLTAQREGPEKQLEECSIFFQSGQIVSASIGYLQGSDALKKISTWQKCHFIFQAQSLPGNASQTRVLRAIPPMTSERSSNPIASAIPARTPQYQNRMPDFVRLGLSRTHRQLFLLADGQRSKIVLAKLIGRNLAETQVFLKDLENLGLLR